MVQIQKINDDSEIIQQDYEVTYWNINTNVITVIAPDEITATTHVLGVVKPTPNANQTATSATVQYTVIPIYHHHAKKITSGDPISRSHVVTFAANKSDEDIIRKGSFYDETYTNIKVKWSLTQNGKFKFRFVDLGITNSEGKRILFGNANIGATSEEDFGKYYQWGDTVGYYSGTSATDENTAQYHSYWKTAPFNGGNTSANETYWNSIKDTVVSEASDGYYNLNSEYDAATVEYGEGCRLITVQEIKLLSANTNATLTTINGVSGCLITSLVEGYTDKSIFVPTAGYFDQGQFIRSSISFWGCTTSNAYSNAAYHYNGWGAKQAAILAGQYYAYPMRAVKITD